MVKMCCYEWHEEGFGSLTGIDIVHPQVMTEFRLGIEKIAKQSKFKVLQKFKVPLTEDERKEVFRRDAVWHYADSIDPNTGKKVHKVSAVWKSVNPKTKETTFVTSTHRAYNKRPTLAGAISRYHKFIKGTA